MTRILFVCVENSCRSQMAEGFARRLGEGRIEAYSAGSKATGSVNSEAVVVMKEVGIDISGQSSKGFTDLPVAEFDYVVTMGCQDICPFFPAKAELAWQIDDPKGGDRQLFRRVRGEIEQQVARLIEIIAKTKKGGDKK